MNNKKFVKFIILILTYTMLFSNVSLAEPSLEPPEPVLVETPEYAKNLLDDSDFRFIEYVKNDAHTYSYGIELDTGGFLAESADIVKLYQKMIDAKTAMENASPSNYDAKKTEYDKAKAAVDKFEGIVLTVYVETEGGSSPLTRSSGEKVLCEFAMPEAIQVTDKDKYILSVNWTEDGGRDEFQKFIDSVEDKIRFEVSGQTRNANGELVEFKPSTDVGSDVDVHYDIQSQTGDAGFWGTIIGFLVDTPGTIQRILEEEMTNLFLPLGDGLLFTICKCAGDFVSIERIIFNKVEKLSVDYWDIDPSDTTSLKSYMSPIVVKWYGVFYEIAIIVYMMVLVVVGILVILRSTADKKAKYKEVMVSWVVGVAMLVFFPYVMKYIVTLNNTVLVALADYAGISQSGESVDFTKKDYRTSFNKYGTAAFMKFVSTNEMGSNEDNILGTRDTMLTTRGYAQLNQRIVLVVLYFVFLGQTIVLLFMYYKRAFMLAFLITIFPLVAMTYVVDKLGDKKAQSFGIWFKEYIVNVIVQAFHGITYVVIVKVSIENFLEASGGFGSNWLFMLMCVLFLFEGEKILRNIFGVKSAAGTVGDLAAAGMAAYGVAKHIGDLKPDNDKDIAGKQDKSDSEEVGNRNAARQQDRSAEQNIAAATSGDGGQNGAPPPPPQGSNVANGGGFDGLKARDTAFSSAITSRMKAGLATKAVKMFGKTGGALVGMTYGLSKGDTEGGGLVGNAVVGATAGKVLGDAITKPAQFVANKAEQVVHGERQARAIENGSRDHELGLDMIPPPPPDVNESEIINKYGETQQEAYRKALAEYTRVAARKGKARAEEAYWKFMEEHSKH